MKEELHSDHLYRHHQEGYFVILDLLLKTKAGKTTLGGISGLGDTLHAVKTQIFDDSFGFEDD